MPDDSLSPDAAAPQVPQVPVAPPSVPSSAPNAPPAPDVSGLSPDRQSPMPAPQVDPVKEHHAAIGHALSRVAAALEGKEISYVPDEQNPGQIHQVVQPRKAGGFWRDVLLGAVAGGSAGAQLRPGAGAVSGAAVGAQAGLNSLDAGQEKRKQAAQQDADAYKKDQERIFQQSQVALHNISNLVLDHHADLHDPSNLASYNTSQNLVKKLALDNGAMTPQIVVGGKDLNGQVDNGGPLLEMFQRDPQSVMKAPDGYHRVALQNIDTSGLTFKPGVGYVDDKGQRVDLADRTTFNLIDVPSTKWGTTISLSAKQINDVAHGTAIIDPKNPDRKMSTTFGSLLGLSLQSIKDLNDAHAELHAPPKDENEAMSWKAFAEQVKSDPEATPEDRQRAEIKGKMAESFLQSKEDSQKDKPTTPEQDKLRTRELEKKLDAGTLTADERTDLISRQQEAKTQGLGSEIISQVGKPPVPAMYSKGSSDPAFKKDDAVWGAAAQKKKTAETTAAANVRVEGYAASRELPVMDTKNGNTLQYLSAAEINTANKTEPGRYVPAQQGMAALKPIALLEDVRGNIMQTRDALNGLKTDFDKTTRAKIAVALRSSDPRSAFSTLMTNLDIGSMPDDQQSYIQALASLAENSMSLRGITGGGNAEDARSAIRAMLPSGSTPTKAYGLKQLDLLEKTVDRLRRGQPTVPLTGGAPGAGSQNGQQNSGQTQKQNLPAVQPGFVRFQDSRGGIHDIPQQNLKAAQQRDPQLQVIQ